MAKLKAQQTVTDPVGTVVNALPEALTRPRVTGYEGLTEWASEVNQIIRELDLAEIVTTTDVLEALGTSVADWYLR
ncbi:hypothetical protein QSJ18_16140 [Gordonia sp. ABSL1-1]|uniref:hypothetical protein n=1 Tax=Gordonia sp. ABSL1-1 TaxID=3053923 RepID=UPI002572F69E|nr:hypothetical protein [Gordonia sp. ABSL1-1]MDL9938282.1 hypothetical protein [Gordonia sp. ABSL1-1]